MEYMHTMCQHQEINTTFNFKTELVAARLWPKIVAPMDSSLDCLMRASWSALVALDAPSLS